MQSGLVKTLKALGKRADQSFTFEEISEDSRAGKEKASLALGYLEAKGLIQKTHHGKRWTPV